MQSAPGGRSLGIASLSTAPMARQSRSGRARLLSLLYRSMSRLPKRELALRPSGEGNLRWTVTQAPALATRFLIIQRPGLRDISIPLDNSTIAQVRDGLLGSGVQLSYVTSDPVLLNLSALTLIPGTGEAWQSNGDHIYLYRSLLWAWADPLGRWLDQSRLDIAEMLRMLVVRQTGGQWSDLWASYFGIQKRPNESDASQNRRTEWEWRRPRNSAKAMELNIRHLLDQKVTVREPWKEMMIVSGSAASGNDHLPNDAEFAYHRAQLTSRDVFIWDDAMVEAQADRPAGTLLIDPVTNPWPWQINAQIRGVEFGSSPTFSTRLQDRDGQVISVNWNLSNTYVLLNQKIVTSEDMDFISEPMGPAGDIGNHRTIAKGEMVVSEQWPLGHDQQHLGGRMRREDGDGLVLSGDQGLSDYSHKLRWVPIDEWLQDDRAYDPPIAFTLPLQGDVAPEQSFSGSVLVSLATVDLGIEMLQPLGVGSAYDGGWKGAWNGRSWISGYPSPLLAFKSTQSLPDATPISAQSASTAALSAQTRFAAARSATPSATAALSTAIRMAGSAAAVSGQLSTFGNRMEAQAALVVNAVATAALSTAINMAGAGSAVTTSIAAATAQIRLQGSGAAVSSVTKAVFASSDLAAAVGSTATSVSDMQTRAQIVAAISAQSSASVVLTVGPRFSTQAAAVSAGQGMLLVSPQFNAVAQASSTASAGLAVGARFIGIGLGQASASAPAMVNAPARMQATVSAVSGVVASNLRIGARFAASRGAVSTAAAATLSATGVQVWPETNRTYLFDPDASSATQINSKFSRLDDVSGNGRFAFQNYDPARPPQATIGNRSMMDINGYSANLDLDGAAISEFGQIAATATYHIVFRTPQSLWTGALPLLGGLVSGTDNPASMLGLESAENGRSLLDFKQNGSGFYAAKSNGINWSTETNYLLTYRRNSDGTTDFYVDGVKQSTFGTPVPPGSTADVNGAQVGTYWPVPFSTTYGGYLGAVMRYGVAQSDAEITQMAAVKASRYGGAGGPIGPTTTYRLFANDTPTIVAGDPTEITAGNKIRTTRSGTVIALRFWRGSTTANYGTLRLWSGDGTLLAEVAIPAFTVPAGGNGVAAGGWQQVTLPSPVTISSGLYVVSYNTWGYGYALTNGYFGADVRNGPLIGPADGGADGANGIAYIGSGHNFPVYGNAATNFFADMAFQ